MGKGRRRKEGGGSGRVGGGGKFEEKSTVTLVEATKAFQLWERLTTNDKDVFSVQVFKVYYHPKNIRVKKKKKKNPPPSVEKNIQKIYKKNNNNTKKKILKIKKTTMSC